MTQLPAQKPKSTSWGLVFLLAFICASLTLAAGGYLYYQNQIQPAASYSGSSDTQNFTVKPGQGPAAVAQNLKAAGLIRNSLLFRYQIKKLGLEGKIRAGVFPLTPTMTPTEIITALTTPPQQVSITFLPGWRREEFASYLTSLNLANFSEKDFLTQTKDLEGQLWADTYFIFPTATTTDIIKLLTQTFAQKFTTPYAAQISSSPHSLNEILTIASILQRESKTKPEMQMIAGIIENRLQITMPLQFCATAQYAVGYNPTQKSWWVEPTLLDTKTPSPYNTYVNPGLPPAPIAAPGINALEAALSPTSNDYLFYLHDPQGNIYYGKNLDQRQANIAEYLN